MRGTSEASRDAVLKDFFPVATAAGKDAARLAEELFSVVDALDSSGSLRRALSDPARPGTDKTALVEDVFGSLDPRVRDVIAAFASRRWILADDMADAVEDAAVDAYLSAAQAAGELESLEEELFRVERFLAAERDLLAALGDRSALPTARSTLATSIFGTRVSPIAMALIERAAGESRSRRLSSSLAYYVKAAAERRQRVIAAVTSAVELSAAQRTRLARALQGLYGSEVQLNVTVDPRVIGGLRVQVGDQVVDGTILRKIDDVRRRLVG